MLSEHFSLKEFLDSQTAARLGLSNEPNDAQIAAMKALCSNVLELVRDVWGPIRISSGFRSPELNEAIGGSKSSQHMLGQAADLIPLDAKIGEVFAWIATGGDGGSYEVPFDQLIWEFGGAWVHVSYRENLPNRRTILEATRENGLTIYKPLTPEEAAALG